MTREQLKAGFRKLLNRVFDVDAYFDRVFKAGELRHSRERVNGSGTNLKQQILLSSISAARAIMLVGVMAGQGQLMRHLRACRRVLRRNACVGSAALGFGELVESWITYWHFASVTRQISGTQFGNVPAQSTGPAEHI
jgi:hypothetical protein